jgi:hypothetical protein
VSEVAALGQPVTNRVKSEGQTIEQRFEEAAARIDAVAREVELARKHLETTALRFREHEPARAGAHGFAAFGHLTRALSLLEAEAYSFATHSEPAPESNN